MSATKNNVKLEKTAKPEKKTVDEPVMETVEKSQEMFVQYGDKEVNMKDILNRVEEIWTKDWDNKAEDLKDVKVYLKIEDNAAYFVINGDITGSFGL